MKTEFVLQFAGIDKSQDDLVRDAESAWKNAGHSADEIKKISMYVQPETRKTYFVINDDDSLTGEFDM